MLHLVVPYSAVSHSFMIARGKRYHHSPSYGYQHSPSFKQSSVSSVTPQAYDKLHTNSASLAQLLLRELPEFAEPKEEKVVVDESPVATIAEAPVPKENLWDNDEEKNFYEAFS